MTQDARFEDGADKPVNLGAFDAEDLQVISALVQDAVFQITDLRWDRAARRLALLVNRVRWEDALAAQQGNRPPERVRALLVIDQVTGSMRNSVLFLVVFFTIGVILLWRVPKKA